ncbi:hypothetical protein Ae201684P_011525 [Aphanomyces euteiches]|nr:hypothetical protein Ae201684P_011525 [Aphanomyces euteiches]
MFEGIRDKLSQSMTLPSRGSPASASTVIQHDSALAWWAASTRFVKNHIDQLKEPRQVSSPAPSSESTDEVSHMIQPPLHATFKVYFPKLDYTAAS